MKNRKMDPEQRSPNKASEKIALKSYQGAS